MYVKFWFTCTIAVQAPINDLNLLKTLQDYRTIDQEIADGIIQKFLGHTWYLGNILAGLAFFDSRIDHQTKVNMVNALNNDGDEAHDIENSSITASTQISIVDLISNRTKQLFNILSNNEDPAFMLKHPSEWSADDEFKKMIDTVNSLKLVNDTAERAIGLLKQFNNTLTKSQDGSVENFRARIPNPKKKTICNALIEK